MTVESDSGIDRVAADLEVLRARIDGAKAEAEARAQTTAAQAREVEAAPPRPPPDRSGWQPARRNLALALALALILVAAAVTAIISNNGGPDSRVPEPAAVTDAPAAVEPGSPDRADGAATRSVAPVTADGDVPSAEPPTPAATAPDAATTVVVEVGDSFWSIAQNRLASARGSPPTTAEVAAYWADLIEANQHRLAHASNPDLIYPGQTFSLP